MNNILNYTLKELQEIFRENGLKEFLATQVFDWIYKKRIIDFDQMSNISKVNKEFLKNNFSISWLKPIIIQEDPVDKTKKFLFELNDQNKIETVLMKFNYGYSVCVTTQVGCNMGCKFCASGLLKKKRNLETFEIVAQILTIQKYLDEINERVSNIVVMGIGEPFDNYDNVSKFLKIINEDKGLQIGARKVTVSTCGLINKFDDFINDHPQTGLAISLHASNNELRNQLMPINKAFDIYKLIDACKNYVKKTNRRITFEYLMLNNVNDTKQHAFELVKLLKDILCYVNLIPYNAVDEHEFQRSKHVREFFEILNSNGIITTIRQEKGANIDAACGQLRSKQISKESK